LVHGLVEGVPDALLKGHGGSLGSKFGESVSAEYAFELPEHVAVLWQIIRTSGRAQALQRSIGSTDQPCGALMGTQSVFGGG
jgi:hypothetical protein